MANGRQITVAGHSGSGRWRRLLSVRREAIMGGLEYYGAVTSTGPREGEGVDDQEMI